MRSVGGAITGAPWPIKIGRRSAVGRRDGRDRLDSSFLRAHAAGSVEACRGRCTRRGAGLPQKLKKLGPKQSETTSERIQPRGALRATLHISALLHTVAARRRQRRPGRVSCRLTLRLALLDHKVVARLHVLGLDAQAVGHVLQKRKVE